MGLKLTDEFRKDAVRIALTSGLKRKQVADDLGVGMSTLNKWISAHRDTDVVSKEDLGLAQENDRLRRESRILKDKRGIPKQATVLFASQKAVRFKFIEAHRSDSRSEGCAMSWMSARAGYVRSAVAPLAAEWH